MQQFRHLWTPVLCLLIITAGSALITTFLALKLNLLHVSPFLIGLLTTAYYSGMALGAFQIEPIIMRIGHIRAYAGFASVLAVITICHGFWINPYFWIFLRFLGGLATAGLYVVIESWILSGVDAKQRGFALGFYMVSLYVAQSGGQWLINLGGYHSLMPYAIAAMLASLSVIPLTMLRTPTPIFSEPETLSISKMFQLSPSGTMTCMVGGLVLGALYGLYPIFIQSLGYHNHQISVVMSVLILGGMCFQIPIGKLSDRVPRRNVIAALGLSTCILSILIVLFANHYFFVLVGFSFLFGGATFCLYPIGISHACDRVNNDQIVSATQTLLLFYGVGAALGPLFSPLFGLMLFVMIMSVLLFVFILIRKTIKDPVLPEDKQDFVPTTELTPINNEMDPRSEED